MKNTSINKTPAPAMPRSNIPAQSDGTKHSDAYIWTSIARELHDGVTQELWYLHSELSRISERMPDEQVALREQLTKLTSVAHDAYSGIRTILDQLNTRGKQYVNLISELNALTDKFSCAVEMDIEFQSIPASQTYEVSGQVGRQVCRLVQEALWNSWRHSMSNKATVVMRHSKVGLVISVSDDGCGFRPDQVDESHYGLRNMRERAESINGKLYLSTRIGTGTVVSLHWSPESLQQDIEEMFYDGS